MGVGGGSGEDGVSGHRRRCTREGEACAKGSVQRKQAKQGSEVSEQDMGSSNKHFYTKD